MTLEEAIKHCEEVAHEKCIESNECINVNDLENAEACYECGEAHKQLASWLTELKRYRESDKQVLEINPWIPCSERLPHGGRVLATTKQGYVVDVIFVVNGCQWFRNGEYFRTDDIIAWMPMPKAYEQPNNMIGD